jgi:cation transport regulator ChaB
LISVKSIIIQEIIPSGIVKAKTTYKKKKQRKETELEEFRRRLANKAVKQATRKKNDQ